MVSGRPAEQLVDGLAQHLALEIPQRQVNAADGVRRQAGGAEGRAQPHQHVVEPLGRQRGLTNDARRQVILDDGGDGTPISSGADPLRAVLRRHHDEKVRPVRHPAQHVGRGGKIGRHRIRHGAPLEPAGASPTCIGIASGQREHFGLEAGDLQRTRTPLSGCWQCLTRAAARRRPGDAQRRPARRRQRAHRMRRRLHCRA